MFRRILVILAAAAVTAASLTSCASRRDVSTDASSAPASSAVSLQTGSGVSSAVSAVSSARAVSSAPKAVSKAAPTVKRSSKTASKSKAVSALVSKPKPNVKVSSAPAPKPAAPTPSKPANATTMTKAQLISLFEAAEAKSNALNEADIRTVKKLAYRSQNLLYDEMDIKKNGEAMSVDEKLSYLSEGGGMKTVSDSYYYDGQYTYVHDANGVEQLDLDPNKYIVYTKDIELSENDITVNSVVDDGDVCELDFTTTNTTSFKPSFEYLGYDYDKSEIAPVEVLVEIDRDTGYLVSQIVTINFNGYVSSSEYGTGWENDMTYTEDLSYTDPGSSVTVSKWEN